MNQPLGCECVTCRARRLGGWTGKACVTVPVELDEDYQGIEFGGPAARGMAEVMLGEPIADLMEDVVVKFERHRIVFVDGRAPPIEVKVEYEDGDFKVADPPSLASLIVDHG